MHKKFIYVALISFSALTATAQQGKAPEAGSNTVQAYARGDDSYLLFSKDTYKADKKYVIIKFWNEKESLSEAEKTEFLSIKSQLSGKNIEIVDFSWKSEEDLKEVLNKYGLSVEVLGEKRIQVKNDHMTLHTTSGKAVFVAEEGKPISLCSGADCEARLKPFFNLSSGK